MIGIRSTSRPRWATASVTAHAMHDDRDRLLAAGFDGYIEKPVDVRALPGQVQALLS